MMTIVPIKINCFSESPSNIVRANMRPSTGTVSTKVSKAPPTTIVNRLLFSVSSEYHERTYWIFLNSYYTGAVLELLLQHT